MFKRRRERERKKNEKCLWQTKVVPVKDGKETKEENYYLCLVHGEVVKMENGVKPKHN